MTYEATLNASGWHVYRVSHEPEIVRVCIASFGYGDTARWKAERAAQRLISGELA